MGKKREKTKYLHILFIIVPIVYHRLRMFFLKKKGEREEKRGMVRREENQSIFILDT